MNKLIIAVIVLFAFSGAVDAQPPQRVVVSRPYYNGYNLQPGYSTYSNGTYSVDRFVGRSYYYPGYTLPYRYRYRYNGIRFNSTYGYGYYPYYWGNW